jgi:superinfection exclusion protein gp17
MRVWWIPQVPGKPFHVEVSSPAEAGRLMGVLAKYDLFQFENRIKPDYCNVGGLEVRDGREWVEWCDPDGDDINDLMRKGASL